MTTDNIEHELSLMNVEYEILQFTHKLYVWIKKETVKTVTQLTTTVTTSQHN